ncbi:MAG: transglutaminase domain-containing protein [Deltaproteobacteria bacterium]|nr:transglutaminase domain-containing protein [Deltaproteobacteria bacterium]
MMIRKKNKFLFNLFGIVIVTFWLVMIGLLVKKVHFKDHPTGIDYDHQVSTIDTLQREWKEIYLNDKKVGYAVNLIKPFKEGYFIQEEVFLKLNLMGMASGIHTITQSRIDNKFLLKSFNFGMTSGVVRFDISGRVTDGELLIETGKGRDRRTHRIKLSSPPMIGSGVGYFFKSKKINVGDTFRLPIFDPSTMAQKVAVIKVVDTESIEINRRRYNTFRLEMEMWGRLMTFWLDEDGTTLKEEGFMGLTIVRSSAANAPRDMEVEGEEDIDFYEMIAIKPDKKLPDPTRLSYLKLKVDGMDNAHLSPGILNGGRQRFHGGIMEIDKESLPIKALYFLPYEDYSDEMRPFLEPEFNIESDEEEIINIAMKISGKDKNPISVAGKLLSWVYRKLEKRPVVIIPSALEVLRTRVGDCNEHATLLTALLRASGIPSRLSVGLVYTRGKFFYHAWTEAYLGEWISMDATLNQMPVDATHIKLVQGNLDKQVGIAGLIGTINLKVLDYRF